MKSWVVLGGLVAFAATWIGCQQNAVTVPVRSLERSGKAAFFCIRNPVASPPGIELRGCAPVATVLDVADYSQPHMISLVTQEARGELAVLDITAGVVIDVDSTLPGSNFLPVGAFPTDVVTTPGSTAAFVAIGDPLRPGIFGLTSSNLFLPYQARTPSPTLAGFPACALPGVPTQVLLISDRTGQTDQSAPRDRCPNAVAEPPSGNAPVTFPGIDLSAETPVFGTQKLLALMPDLGQIAVIDAQTLLRRELGSFDACPIERVITLRSDLVPAAATASDGGASGSSADSSAPSEAGAEAASADAGDDSSAEATAETDAADASADGVTCTAPPTYSVPPPPLTPHPVAMAYADDGRLFVSDDRASVIHVVDLADPCSPVERDSLLPQSRLEPTRAVTTSALAVSPLLGDGTRFVYAVDVKNSGSVMVFDVSTGSTTRTPLLRPDVVSSQLEPPDRLAYSSPVVSLTFALHDLVPTTDTTAMNVVSRAARCDPTNGMDVYRPQGDFVNGAGPHILRGVFAYLALSDGRLAVVDVDDFDANCRRPDLTVSPLLACDPSNPPLPADTQRFPAASQEVSCNVVERHRPRSNQFFTNAETAGLHAPAMQGFPILHDKDGTTLSTDPTLPQAQQRPKLLPPNVSAAMGGDSQAVQDILAVTGILPSPPDATWYSPTQAAQNAVAFDLQEPRAHTSQVWTVTYEGAFAKGAAGRLQCADQNKTPITCELGANPSHFQLFDSSAGFCGMGIQGNDLAQSTGMSQGDVIEVTSDFPDPNDSYWTSVSGTCGRQTCESAYGTIDNLIGTYSDSGAAIGRDFIVDRAFQDHLELAPSPERDSGTLRVPIACCFPYPVSYSARGGKQWILAGSVNGFAHHEIPDPSLSDPSTGACVLSCDPTLALRNGRALALSPPADEMLAGAIPAYDGDPRTFRNSALRFVVWNPQVSDCSTGSGVAGTVGAPQACVRRDMYFLFQESGGFDPLVISLSAATLILPESISFVPGLEQLAIPDPVSQGLMLFDLNALRIIQTIF